MAGPPAALRPVALHPFGDRFRPRAFLRYLRLAVPVLFGRPIGDRHLLKYIGNRPDVARALQEFSTEMPQAVVVDDVVEADDTRDWRLHFLPRLQGEGLEIGPLHRPLQTHPGMRMTYVDRDRQEALQRLFPQLADAIVPVHIIDDAETLARVEADRYDFVVASHVIEHMRNPIGALRNWMRVVKPGGLLYLVVPDKRRSFDRRRVRTTLEHLILDYEEPSEARDFEHFLEYAALVHDATGTDALAEARRLAAENYSIHFHVFIPADIVALVRWASAHVTPIEIAGGPALNPDPHEMNGEFHVLLRKPA